MATIAPTLVYSDTPASPEALPQMLARQQEAAERDPYPSYAARIVALDAVAGMLIGNRDAIARAIAADFGHRAVPETEILELAPSLAAVRYARGHLKRWMKPERRRVALTFQPARAWVQYQPLGVVGVISPWNYPLYLAISPLVDALAAGNRVLIKPSELTPGFSELLRRMVADTFDPDQVAVAAGGPDVADAFSRLPFDHLLFTGSTHIGRKVMAAAAQNLTPVTLELGGKSPVILCPGYDPAKAARAVAVGKFLNAGQTCVAPDYVLAPAAQVDTLGEAVVAAARRLYPTIAGNVDYSSIISDRHFGRLTAMIEEARAGGARILTAGDAGGTQARIIPPTVVIDPPRDSALLREEIFGPVLPILPYDTLDGAVAYVGTGERPLALYCFSDDRAEQADVLRRTISGGVTLNGTMLHVAQDDLPFGGVGASGIGAYHGRDGFKRFSHARAVHKVGFLSPLDLMGPPFGKRQTAMLRFLLRR